MCVRHMLRCFEGFPFRSYDRSYELTNHWVIGTPQLRALELSSHHPPYTLQAPEEVLTTSYGKPTPI